MMLLTLFSGALLPLNKDDVVATIGNEKVLYRQIKQSEFLLQHDIKDGLNKDELEASRLETERRLLKMELISRLKKILIEEWKVEAEPVEKTPAMIKNEQLLEDVTKMSRDFADAAAEAFKDKNKMELVYAKYRLKIWSFDQFKKFVEKIQTQEELEKETAFFKQKSYIDYNVMGKYIGLEKEVLNKCITDEMLRKEYDVVYPNGNDAFLEKKEEIKQQIIKRDKEKLLSDYWMREIKNRAKFLYKEYDLTK